MKKSTFTLISCLVLTNPALADGQVNYEGGINSVIQTSHQAGLNAGTEASADLVTTYQKGAWQTSIHFEGNLTPPKGSVADKLPDTNNDLDSAADENGHGRLQVSELSFSYTPSHRTLQQISFGMMEVRGFFDGNEVMNDESTQFIATSLVNNATIEFPNYALGITTTYQFQPNLSTTFGLFSGTGLLDNNPRSYDNALKIDLKHKGAFIIAETQLIEATHQHLSIGGWMHTGYHTQIDNAQHTNLSNYGIYLTGSHQMKTNTVGLRLGYANPKVNDYNMVFSISLTHDYSTHWQTGLGGTYQIASSHSSLKDRQTYEAYARYQLNSSDFYITPSVQYLTHTDIGKDVMTANLRLSYLF